MSTSDSNNFSQYQKEEEHTETSKNLHESELNEIAASDLTEPENKEIIDKQTHNGDDKVQCFSSLYES